MNYFRTDHKLIDVYEDKPVEIKENLILLN